MRECVFVTGSLGRWWCGGSGEDGGEQGRAGSAGRSLTDVIVFSAVASGGRDV